MKIAKTCKKTALFSMMIALSAVSMQAPVMADMVDNNQLAMQAELQMQRDDVRNLVARDDVRAALLDYGVDIADIDSRIGNLSESELLQIQNQLDQLPAGADGVISAILLVILIFVLLDVLGVTDVFPRV